MKARKPDVVEVTDESYQPTRAELNEAIKLRAPKGMSLNSVVKLLLRPVEFREISAREHRARRSRDSA